MILGTLGLNLVGSQVVDHAQSAIVVTLLAVFAVFVVVTIADADWGLLAFSGTRRSPTSSRASP